MKYSAGGSLLTMLCHWKSGLGSLTACSFVTGSLAFVGKFEWRTVNRAQSFTWWIKILMRLSWSCQKLPAQSSWFSFRAISIQDCHRSFRSDKTIPKSDFLEICSRRLCRYKVNMGWPWKWMICSLSKTTLSQSGALTETELKVLTLTGLTTATYDFLETELKHTLTFSF